MAHAKISIKKMNRKSKVLRAGIIIAGLFVIAGAWNGFSHEYRFATAAQSETGADSRQVLAGLNKEGLPMSARGLRNMMRNCAALIFDKIDVKVSDNLKSQVDQTCQNRARDILQRNPSHPEAHAIALATATELLPESYAKAQAAAAYEPWPLQIRLLALERAVLDQPLPEDLKSLAAQDISRALEAHWSRQVLASLYLKDAGLAALIKSVAETAPNDQQRAFLNVLRNMMDRNRG